MGLLEVNQIKSKLKEEYSGFIDLSDINTRDEEEFEKYFLTRSLAAFSINILYPYVEKEAICKNIVDGSDDNGIDLIYYNKESNELCLVQSKFNHKGDSEPELGEIKKFVDGVRDLINLKFDKFNKKVNEMRDEIISILKKSGLRFKIILVYTAINLSSHAKREFDELLEELNDFRDVADLEIINQKRVHASINSQSSKRAIDIEITLKQWGRYEGEMEAFYGQISADQIANWWEEYGNSLFENNIRKLLGNTDINDEIRATLETDPELFWYFNNGVTLVCEDVDKKRIFGNIRDVGIFECKGISIVNGAQTVGVIGKYGQSSEENKKNLENVFLPFRIISIKRTDEDGEEYLDENFASEVTTKNNRQNKIENRDFVVLDPVQRKIESDLAIEGITYHLMRSEDEEVIGEKSFSLKEATRALSFATDIDATILVSREINLIYSDLTHSRYKKLFNPSITSYYVWNCVQLQREIEKVIDELSKEVDNIDGAILIHGKELISKILFDVIGVQNIERYRIGIEEILKNTDIKTVIKDSLETIRSNIEKSEKPIANIFKSPNDVRSIYFEAINKLGKGDIGKTHKEVIFDVNQLENFSRVEKLRLSKFITKIQKDELALEFFEKWLTEIYKPKIHTFSYMSNIHFYLNDDSLQATEKFLFRIAFYTKMIVSFQFNVYGTNYKSILYDNEEFAKWAKQNTDSKNRIVIENRDDLARVLSVKQFIV